MGIPVFTLAGHYGPEVEKTAAGLQAFRLAVKTFPEINPSNIDYDREIAHGEMWLETLAEKWKRGGEYNDYDIEALGFAQRSLDCLIITLDGDMEDLVEQGEIGLDHIVFGWMDRYRAK